MKAKLHRVFRILPWVLLTAVAGYLFFADGLRDIVLGHSLGKARFFFYEPGAITEVKIYCLAGSPGTAEQGTFPILPYGKDVTRPVYGSIRDLRGRTGEIHGLLDVSGSQYRKWRDVP